MKLSLYDFDGTIYDGDSSVDFYIYCFKKYPKIRKGIFKIILYFFKYLSKSIDVTELKEVVFSYLNYIDNIDEEVNNFWKTHEKNLKEFYINKNHDNDIIISASPEFLLKPICEKLKVKDLIGSDIDKKTGKFNKKNNSGEEKVKAFYEKYPDAIIMEMYSDSLNDKPLLDIAKQSFMIKKDKIINYKDYKPSFLKKIINIYNKKQEIWNYIIIGGLTTLVSILTYAIASKLLNLNYLISNIISWCISVTFAYYTNRWFVFNSKNKNKLYEFIKFTGSRVLTLLIDMGLMILLVECVKMDDMIAKIIVQFVVIVGNYILSKLIVFK